MRPVSHTTLPSGRISCQTTDLDHARHLLDEWTEWASSAPPGNGERRDRALENFQNCLENKNDWLDLSELNLMTLPENWPASLRELDLSDNQLTTLPASLPASLRKLDLGFNQLTALPASLPAALQLLYVFSNQLTVLPASLSDSLQLLDASNNQLTALPAALPALIQELDVSDNQLTVLPEVLPTSLRELNASNNRLTSLPAALPGSLECLIISYNELMSLPATLPSSLQFLNVRSNWLTVLPDNLPASLWRLDIRNNRLTALPEALPASLHNLDLDGNPLANLARGLPDDYLGTIAHWTDGDNAPQWQKIQSENGAMVFADFLRKLYGEENSLSEALRGRVREWLGYLSTEESSELRKQTFLVAEEAAASCVDRAAFYFNRMYWLMMEDKAIKSGVDAAQLIETIRSGFRLQVIERIAAVHAQRRRHEDPGFAEDIEIYLAYEYGLRESLSLPVYTTLQFTGVAQLTEEEMAQAGAAVRRQEQTDFLRYLVTESAAWRQRLKSWDSEKIAAVEASYLEAIVSADFNEAVEREIKENNLSVDDSDARRAVSKKIAEAWLFAARLRLTEDYLAAHKALPCLAPFRDACTLTDKY